MDLSKTELAVLACETGLGTIDHQEEFGYKGLSDSWCKKYYLLPWQVPDRETKILRQILSQLAAEKIKYSRCFFSYTKEMRELLSIHFNGLDLFCRVKSGLSK
jgi:hypothetical protein